MVRRSRSSRNEYPGIDPQAMRAIRYRATQLAGRGGFADMEPEDLEQEFVVDLLDRIPKYDPKRGALSTFVRQVVEHRVAVMLRHRGVAKRATASPVVSLNAEVNDDCGQRVELWSTVTTETQGRRTGAADPDSPAAHDLRLDVRAAVEGLPPAQRDYCAWLCHHSVSEASRAAQMARSTVHDHMRDIRTLFREKGVDAYVGPRVKRRRKRRPALSGEPA